VDSTIGSYEFCCFVKILALGSRISEDPSNYRCGSNFEEREGRFFFCLVRFTSSVVVIRVFLFPLLRQGFGFSLENPEYCVLVWELQSSWFLSECDERRWSRGFRDFLEMGKKQHSKDRMFITSTEWATEWGGAKFRDLKSPFKRLPFYCCACVSLPSPSLLLFDPFLHVGLVQQLFSFFTNVCKPVVCSSLHLLRTSEPYWACLTQKTCTSLCTACSSHYILHQRYTLGTAPEAMSASRSIAWRGVERFGRWFIQY
jgi:hypothetical protein